MLGYSRRQLFKGFSAAVGIVSIVSLFLIYFFPAPPSKITMATAFKGSSFEYYGRQYREIFARSNVDLELRPTSGAGENLKLLQDPSSDVQFSLMVSGISDGKHAPGLLSLGTVYNNPWVAVFDFHVPPKFGPVLRRAGLLYLNVRSNDCSCLDFYQASTLYFLNQSIIRFQASSAAPLCDSSACNRRENRGARRDRCETLPSCRQS